MFTLDPQQLELKGRVFQALQTHNKVCCVSPCGSGKTVIAVDIIKDIVYNGGKVLCIAHRIELVDQMVRTLKKHGVTSDNVIISMKDRVINRKSKRSNLKFIPTHIITDEAHHATADTYKKIYKLFCAKHIGFTATPCRLDGKPLKEVFNVLVVGESVKDLIKRGRLAPFKMFSASYIDLSKLHKRLGDFEKGEISKAVNKHEIFANAVCEYHAKAEGKKTIIYCPSIESSQNIISQFKNAGYKAEHLDGETPEKQRAEVIEKFRNGEITILSNVDLFGEGFDVPDCECVILLRPTMSLNLYLQQAMRCMRSDPNNPDKVAIIIDLVGNYVLHGLPDVERAWTLDGQIKADTTKKRPVCPVCKSATFKRNKPCEICGYVSPPPEPRKSNDHTLNLGTKEIQPEDIQIKMPVFPYVQVNYNYFKPKKGWF